MDHYPNTNIRHTRLSIHTYNPSPDCKVEINIATHFHSRSNTTNPIITTTTHNGENQSSCHRSPSGDSSSHSQTHKTYDSRRSKAKQLRQSGQSDNASRASQRNTSGRHASTGSKPSAAPMRTHVIRPLENQITELSQNSSGQRKFSERDESLVDRRSAKPSGVRYSSDPQGLPMDDTRDLRRSHSLKKLSNAPGGRYRTPSEETWSGGSNSTSGRRR